MTKQDMDKQLKNAMSILGSAGYVDEKAISFIYLAVQEKLYRSEDVEQPEVQEAKEYTVKQNDYIQALNERKDRMDDAGFGKFVKKTLWTVLPPTPAPKPKVTGRWVDIGM